MLSHRFPWHFDSPCRVPKGWVGFFCPVVFAVPAEYWDTRTSWCIQKSCFIYIYFFIYSAYIYICINIIKYNMYIYILYIYIYIHPPIMKDSHGKLPCWMSKPPTNWWLSMAVFHRPRWERLCESHGHSWSLGSKMLTGFQGEPTEWVVNSWTIFFASSIGIPTNQPTIWFVQGI